jgi:hypothetical protein
MIPLICGPLIDVKAVVDQCGQFTGSGTVGARFSLTQRRCNYCKFVNLHFNQMLRDCEPDQKCFICLYIICMTSLSELFRPGTLAFLLC